MYGFHCRILFPNFELLLPLWLQVMIWNVFKVTIFPLWFRVFELQTIDSPMMTIFKGRSSHTLETRLPIYPRFQRSQIIRASDFPRSQIMTSSDYAAGQCYRTVGTLVTYGYLLSLLMVLLNINWMNPLCSNHKESVLFKIPYLPDIYMLVHVWNLELISPQILWRIKDNQSL